MICKRPDIVQTMKGVDQYMANPSRENYNTIKRILIHIKGISDVAALYYEPSKLTIKSYVNLDFIGDPDKN